MSGEEKTQAARMKLTEDHRRKVLADVFSMLYGKPVHGDTLGIASYMARNCLQELLHKGEIDFVPDVLIVR